MNGLKTASWEKVYHAAPWVASLVLSLVLGFSIGALGQLSYFFALVGAVVLFVMIVENRANVMYMYVALVPLSNSFFVQDNLFGIQGMKPFNLLGALVLALALIRPQRANDAERRTDTIFNRYFAVYALIFVVTVVRSLSHLPNLHLALPELFPAGALSHLMTHLVRPALYLAPMLFIVFNVITKKDLEKTVWVLCLSAMIFSICVVGLFFGFRLWSSAEYHRHILIEYLGYHYNFLATHYIIMTPILFQKALTKKPFYVAAFIISAMAVACLKSRTAYALFVFAVTFMLWFTGRRKIFPIITLLVLMIGPYLIPSWLIERALYGVSSGNMNDLSADRLDAIWLPLITERLENIPALLFGLGRFSMVLSKAHVYGEMLQVYGAHNAFLELALDSGLIVMIAFVVFLVRMGRMLVAQALARKDDFFWAMVCSYVCFLISCMTDRVFYPSYSAVFLLTITGILIVYMRLYPMELDERGKPRLKPAEDLNKQEQTPPSRAGDLDYSPRSGRGETMIS